MTSKLAWLVVQQLRKVWVRVVAYASLALVTVVVAQLASGYLPSGLSDRLGLDAADQILSIMASSMLAVTTFSLSVAVSAMAAAAQSATPRAVELLSRDPTTQNVLATFLGAFLFSLVGLVALKAGFYTQDGEFVLFAATVVVIVFVVVAFLGWIAHLMRFGRMEDTLDRVEEAASAAIALRLSRPCLGGTPYDDTVAGQGSKIRARTVGYVQHVDLEALSEIARKHDTRIWLQSIPGAFIHENGALAIIEIGEVDEKTETAIRNAFTFARSRSFDQDPRFGIVVLAEIATRALSPAVNDPGTAIDVVGRLVRVLSPWRDEECETADYPEVFVPQIKTKRLLHDAFIPIARSADAAFEVHITIHQALKALSSTCPRTFKAPTQQISRDLIDRARVAGLREQELELLRESRIP
jgi:uncharacterized membrane protein